MMERLSLLLLALPCHIVATVEPPVVAASQGSIYGSHPASGVDLFAGIPFAEPPVGNLRFTRAVLNTKPFTGGRFEATMFGPPCIQNPLGDPRPPDDQGEAPPPNEDCLQLNIYRPSTTLTETRPKNLPVMVWIFGGGLCSGFAADRYFNGSEIALKQNVILITVSYRLGALGFLPLDDFPGHGSGGMNGFNDVIVALQWIKTNIEHFGGSNDDVTLFGQSSGGYTVCNLCVSPAATGLFNRAIIQSGPCIQGPPGKGWGAGPRDIAVRVTREIMKAVNASTIDDLRKVEAEKIQWPAEFMNDLKLAPYFSGYFNDEYIIPGGDAERLWRSGFINPNEMIVGHASKDGTAAFYGSAPTLGLVPPDKKQTSPIDYSNALVTTWGQPLASKIEQQYPLSQYGGSPQSAYIQTDADVFVICPSMSVAQYGSESGRRVWNFEFAHFMPNRGRPDGFGCDNGVELDVTPPVPTEENKRWATHGAEVHYIFGTTVGPDSLGPPNNLTYCYYNDKEELLSEQMMAYWTSFARTGDPNAGCTFDGKPCVEWPLYNASNGTTQLLVDGDVDGASVGPVVGMHKSDCLFWGKTFPTR